MSKRGNITITEPQAKPPEASIEERIIAARDQFYSELSGDLERTITELLTKNYDKLLQDTLGFERDSWSGGYRISRSSRSVTGDRFAKEVTAAAQRTLDSIDFSEITLTPQQIGVVKRAYRDELKQQLSSSARQLARSDALRIASQVLEIPTDEEENE